MVKFSLCSLIALLVPTILVAEQIPLRKCRCLPSDECWPDATAWERFNASVGGRLVAPLPPAYRCHDPHYDELACNEAKRRWADPFWRSQQAGALQWENWESDGNAGCALHSNRSTPCLQGRISAYAVNVSSAADVQRTVEFAARQNLRLVIKNTGHDLLGRSTAPGALSIWTHFLQNITFHEAFTANNCIQEASAVTVGAGVQWNDVYEASHKRNLELVGGERSVGAAGGYVQGGGHSPLSPKHGLSADNVLQFEVVTADGELRTANACQNKDLFWALRGGGGGTFGVVVSVTHRTFPSTPYVAAYYGLNATDSTSFSEFLLEFLRAQPAFSEAGWGGLFLIFDKTMLITYLLPGEDLSIANRSFTPLAEFAQKNPSLSFQGSMAIFKSFRDLLPYNENCENGQACSNPTGVNNIMGSRLIPRDTFGNPAATEKLTQTLLEIRTRLASNSLLFGGLFGGQIARVPDTENAVNPAWRRAQVLMMISNVWTSNTTAESQQAQSKLVTSLIKQLRDITPNSGTYGNEADPNEPNWQESYFGTHYPRLKAIKDQIDPAGLFMCRNCVGSEEWSNDLNCPK
ncbi:uncharacterized protein VTP21DRAFT_8914 [Calcarisporiella thermophila]|uniref:uncharacterized protein n=1 Tax=Calcarisporiella thermophila TaxID=911321 RepID=UPI0037434E1A